MRFHDGSRASHQLRIGDDALREDYLRIVYDVFVERDLWLHEAFGQVDDFRFDDRFRAGHDAPIDFSAVAHDDAFLDHRFGWLLNGDETRSASRWCTGGGALRHTF